MAGRPAIAIELGPRRLCAIAASPGSATGVRVGHFIDEAVPERLVGQSPEALGSWVGERLRAEGFPTGPVTFLLGRERIALKRLILPTTDPNELPEMTRLALQRELTFDAAGAVVDHVPVSTDGTRTTVMAVAVPDTLVDAARVLMKAAGLSLAHLTLRAMGTATLLASRHANDTEGGVPRLVVDVSGGAVEFSVVVGQDIRFSRGVELTDVPTAEAVVTETRRTWMSYRMVDTDPDAGDRVRHALLLGPADVTGPVADEIGGLLDAETEVLRHHPQVETDGDIPIERAWPLVGALLAPRLGHATIDALAPRRAVDRAGERRRRTLMLAALGVLVLLAAWSLGKRELSNLDDRIAALEAERRELVVPYAEAQRERVALEHLERWQEVGADWLDHVRFLTEITPPPEDVVLDGWGGVLEFGGVRYDKKEKTWSAPKELTIVLDGEARNRAIADQVRAAFVAADWYVTASQGSDAPGGQRLPFGFTYRLRTSEEAPPGSSAMPEEGVADHRVTGAQR